MSFRTAYSDFKSGRQATKSQGYFRDPTPEEWKKTMDEYHRQQAQNRYNRCNKDNIKIGRSMA